MLFDIQTLLPWAVITGAFLLAAFWLSLVVWTGRDIRARSINPAARFFAPLWVLLAFLPGWLIYLILRPRRTLESEYMAHLQEEALLQELQGRSLCPVCQRPAAADWLACPHCLTILRRRCPVCSRPVEAGWSLCPYCSTALAQTNPAAAPLAE